MIGTKETERAKRKRIERAIMHRKSPAEAVLAVVGAVPEELRPVLKEVEQQEPKRSWWSRLTFGLFD